MNVNEVSGADALRDGRATRRRHAPLVIDPEEFRRAGHALVDAIVDHLQTLPARPVTRGEDSEAIRALIRGDDSLPVHGASPRELLRQTAEVLFEHSLFNGHPRYFGYITSSPAHIGILADALAAAVNSNVGSFILAPVATEIEAQTIRWIAELIGYPSDCGGVLVSGGNMANIVGLIAARRGLGGDVLQARGLMDAGPGTIRVYASSETHTWIQKATDLAGLGTDSIRWIDTDDALRMNVSHLQATLTDDLAAGDRPLLVVGTAGSVSTGAIDPLHEIAEVCREFGVWFHVDGAYGGFAAVLRDQFPDLGGIGLADSVAIDPHKWLYAPLEAGCALVRDQAIMREAFSYHPPYYHFGSEATNYVDFGPQNSRGFRALKVWLGLKHAGRNGYLASIGDDIRMADRLRERVIEHPDLDLATANLSIVTFRYVPADLRNRLGFEETEHYLDTLNEELLDEVQRSGEAFVSNAVIRGRYLLRACIVNFNTGPDDVDALTEIIGRRGAGVDRRMRNAGGGTG